MESTRLPFQKGFRAVRKHNANNKRKCKKKKRSKVVLRETHTFASFTRADTHREEIDTFAARCCRYDTRRVLWIKSYGACGMQAGRSIKDAAQFSPCKFLRFLEFIIHTIRGNRNAATRWRKKKKKIQTCYGYGNNVVSTLVFKPPPLVP